MAEFLTPDQLRARLRRAGLTLEVIQAAWPDWWSDEATTSTSAQAELRFTLARNLGMSPSDLLREEPVFVWNESAKFKRASFDGDHEGEVLLSFCRAVSIAIAAATTSAVMQPTPSAADLREAVLEGADFVDLAGLLAACWSIGIPVLFLRKFPLAAKRMDAVSVDIDDRPVILLARDTTYPSTLAFTLAHELGHVALGHLRSVSAIVDVDSSELNSDGDSEEKSADEFALELLTGDPAFDVVPGTPGFSATSLARSAEEWSRGRGIDPGVVALSVGRSTGAWAEAYGAMKVLGLENPGLIPLVNGIARSQLNLDGISGSRRSFVLRLLEQSDA